MRILTHVEDSVSQQSMGKFARTVREGDSFYFVTGVHGSFLMLSELHKGRSKGSIVVLEGKLGSGWRGFGIQMRKTIAPVQQGFLSNQKGVSKTVMVAVAEPWKHDGDLREKGEEKILEIQISNNTISSGDRVPLKGKSENIKAQFGGDITSVINSLEVVVSKIH